MEQLPPVSMPNNLKKLFVPELVSEDIITAPFFRKRYIDDGRTINESKLIGIKRYSDSDLCHEDPIIENEIIAKIFNPDNKSTFEIPDNIQDGIFEEIKAEIGKIKEQGKSVKYKNSDALGKIEHFYKSNTHFFIAHEFPNDFSMVKDHDSVRVDYMNALVSDILEANKGITIENDEWVFISHDKDWDGDGIADEEIKSNEELRSKIQLKEGSKLKEVFEKKDTKVFVFQHLPSSDLYVRVIQDLKYTIDILIDENFMSEDLLGKITVEDKKTFE